MNRAIDAIIKAGADPTTLAGSTTWKNELTTAQARRSTDIEERIERLAKLLPRSALDERDEWIDTLRELIDSVTAYATPNSTNPKIEIRRRLAELLEIPTFPNRSKGDVNGSERGTRTPDPRIMIPVL